MNRRKILKTLAIAGVAPLVLPGCDWLFKKKRFDKDGNEITDYVVSEYLVIGKKKSSSNYEIFNLSENSIQSVSQLPGGFTPSSVTWSKKDTALVSGPYSESVVLINGQGKVLKSISLNGEITSGALAYWPVEDVFIMTQSKKGEESFSMVFRSIEDGSEKERFAMENSREAVDFAISGDNVMVVDRSADTKKKPAQILKFSLTDKRFVNSMMINPPYQPSKVLVLGRNCYVSMVLQDETSKEYRAAPLLYFDMKSNKQRFMLTKSNRINSGMVKSTSVATSLNDEVIAFCHQGGKQLTFWSNKDQSFYGMLKLDSEPQYISGTGNKNEFLLTLKDAPTQTVQVSYDKIETTDFSKSSLHETAYIRMIKA